jgi:hypothetical protein
MPRGLGNSSPVREGRDLTYLQAAHDLEAVRRELGIASWVLQGFSGGSQVALLYALTYPDSLAGLIVGHGVASFARAMADSRSIGNPQNPRYRADLSADRRRGAPQRVAVVSSPEHYWLQLRSDLWAFFRGETPLFMMPTEHLHVRFQAACEEVVYFEVADRLKEIRVPVLQRRSGGAYLKMAQQASGFAIVGIAVALGVDAKGRCEEIGIGVTGLGDKPFRARALEERLRGNKLTGKLIEATAAQVAEGIEPLEDLHASAPFRAQLARVYATRAIQRAAKRIGDRRR